MRLPVGSLALRPATLPLGNLRLPIARTLLPDARKVPGQLLSWDLNPQEKQLVTSYDQVLHYGIASINVPGFRTRNLVIVTTLLDFRTYDERDFTEQHSVHILRISFKRTADALGQWSPVFMAARDDSQKTYILISTFFAT